MLKILLCSIFFSLVVLLTVSCAYYQTSGAGAPSSASFTPTPATNSSSQQKIENAPTPPEIGRKIEDFIPPTAKLLVAAEGDLNGDNLPDAAAVFVGDDKATYIAADGKEGGSTFLNRYLLIALRNSDGDLQREAVSRSIVFPVPDFESANIASTKVELKIANQTIFLKQSNGLSAATVTEYEFQIKQKNKQWQITSIKISAADIRSDKTINFQQKRSIAFDNFDIQKITPDFDKNKINLNQ